MKFNFIMESQDGTRDTISYNSHTSELEGFASTPREFKEALRISPDLPGPKVPQVKTLKIQMGLACNYSCSYCNQAFQIAAATVSKLDDAHKFLENLDNWLEGEPETIELWGGEPFVYWAKIKILLPALHERFPKARFVIITNGSLLDREKLDFINKYDIGIAISHDGPGQSVRGPDPLEDPEKRRWIEALLAERKGKVGINVVLTNKNHSLPDIHAWFANELGDDVPLSLEGVVNTYDAATAIGIGRFEEDDLVNLTNQVFYSMVDNPYNFGLDQRLEEFVQSAEDLRPIEALGQKCGMDRIDDIAVDLQGNVMTCQNTGAKGVHKIGHVDDFENIKLDTSYHFAFREECMECPVVQLCKGSCMFLEGDLFKQSCKNEFAFNMGILKGILYQMTGKVLVGIDRLE